MSKIKKKPNSKKHISLKTNKNNDRKKHILSKKEEQPFKANIEVKKSISKKTIDVLVKNQESQKKEKKPKQKTSENYSKEIQTKIGASVRAYEISFRAYQEEMNNYFSSVTSDSYANGAYSKLGKKDSTAFLVFDASEETRQKMISYTKELFQEQIYSAGFSSKIDVSMSREYLLWKSISPINQAFAFIYYDNPSIVDSLKEEYSN